MVILYICVVILIVVSVLVVIYAVAFLWYERDLISTILFLCSFIPLLISIYCALRVRFLDF